MTMVQNESELSCHSPTNVTGLCRFFMKKEDNFILDNKFASKDLKEYKLGAAVRGRRLKEEKVSKLPIQVWARWAELTK